MGHALALMLLVNLLILLLVVVWILRCSLEESESRLLEETQPLVLQAVVTYITYVSQDLFP